MIRRCFVILLTLLLSSYVVADEYLLPEDWETNPRPKNTELLITLNDFNKRMPKYFKTIPQCSAAKLTKPKLFKDGKNAYQEIVLNDSKIDVIAYIAESKKLTTINFTSEGKIKNDNDLRAMICAAYAIIRTLQPEYETQKGALDKAGRIWVLSKDKPFRMTLITDRMTAQHVPFQFDITPTD